MRFLGKIDSDGGSTAGHGDYGTSDPMATVAALAVRAPDGHLMCLAHIGGLVSVARISSAVCGSAHGCQGTWFCMTADRNNIPPSKR